MDLETPASAPPPPPARLGGGLSSRAGGLPQGKGSRGSGRLIKKQTSQPGPPQHVGLLLLLVKDAEQQSASVALFGVGVAKTPGDVETQPLLPAAPPRMSPAFPHGAAQGAQRASGLGAPAGPLPGVPGPGQRRGQGRGRCKGCL